MHATRRFGETLSLALLAGGALLLLAGCGEGRFGSELSARPRPHPLHQTEAQVLRLPQDEAFSIVLTQANRKPGLGGLAESDARADRAGTAEASAAVTDSGEALGLFQLGHAFENPTDRQMDLDLAVGFGYAFEVSATPDSGYPDATAGLRLYARDNRGRLLRELNLAGHSSEAGAARRESAERVAFTLTLPPRSSVNVFLAGQANVNIREGRSAASTVRLTKLEISVATKSAPAVQP